MEYSFVQVQQSNQVGILKLFDPPANTLTYDLVKQLEDAYFEVLHNPEIRVILITGHGDRFFSGGVNISMLLTATPHFKSNFLLHTAEVFNLFRGSSLPVIAAINGHATGGGLEVALTASHRIAIEGDYNLGFPEVRLGVIPGLGGTSRLGQIVGDIRALRMITTGEFISAADALHFGLVDRLLPQQGFLNAAIEYAEEVAVMTAKEKPSAGLVPRLPENLADYIQLTVADGVGTLTLKQSLANLPVQNALCALNGGVVNARENENIEALFIEHEGDCLPLGGTLDAAMIDYADFVFGRLEGWPRLCALHFKGALSALALELALACDYRSCSRCTEDGNLVIETPLGLRRHQRYRSMVELNGLGFDLAAKAGFLDLRDATDTLAFLRTRVPPYGASTAIGYAKLALNQESSSSAGLRVLLERFLQENIFKGPDSEEGMKAYLEKRKPCFVGK